MQLHGFSERLGVALKTGNRLVPKSSDGLGNGVTGTSDATSVSGNEGRKGAFRETGKDLELAGGSAALKEAAVLGEVFRGLSVGGNSVTFTDHSASELVKRKKKSDLRE